MTLSSQMARSDRIPGAVGATATRKSSAAAILLVAGGIVGLALLGWWGVNQLKHTGPQTANASGTQAPAPTPSKDGAGSGTPIIPAAVTPKKEPVEFNMAGKNPPVAPTPTPSPAPGSTLGDANPPTPASNPPAANPPASNPGTPGPSAAPPSPAPAPPTPTPISDLPGDLQQALASADRAMKENRLLEARTLLSRALADTRTPEAEKAGVRRWIGEINETLVFSPTVVPGDPMCESYSLQSGDVLAKLVAKRGLAVDFRFLQRINRIKDAGRLQVGQKVKLIHGPFHAVVHKNSFRLDLYAGDPLPPNRLASATLPDGTEPGWTYIRSFSVGLGEKGLTPLGTFLVKPRSKMVNPPWINPRTGEKFAADDPKNPIGEHWMGLDGVDTSSGKFIGYGVHGTIAPDSIGKEMSMGCVRLLPDDIAVVWEMLQEGVSVVRIVE